MGIEAALMFQAAGMGMQAAGAYSNSKANKAAYNAQAQVAANNAQIAQWQAEDAISRGETAAADQALKTNQIKGTQRARLAANGVDLGVGSALEVLTDTDYFGAIDRGRITDNAAREAWGYRNQAAGFESNASLLKGRADAENPLFASGTSLLTSAGKVAPGWYAATSASGVRSTFGGVDYQKRGDY